MQREQEKEISREKRRELTRNTIVHDDMDNQSKLAAKNVLTMLTENAIKTKLQETKVDEAEYESAFAKIHDYKYALAVTSGTAALRVALASLEIGHGDEVITQSFTFVATVEAIIEAGATPVCSEINETLNICPIDLIEKI